MLQLGIEQELRLIEQRLDARLRANSDILSKRITTLEAPTFEPANFISSPNYLPNSHPEWSTQAYTVAGTLPGTVSDANRACYNWNYQAASATVLSASSDLVASGHSLYAGLAADIPVWDRTNGTFLLGSSNTLYDVSCPLPTDFVFPGQRFYVYFEVSLASATIDKGDDQQLYVGFWDDTNGQWITGTPFTPTISLYGAPGTRTLEYKVYAETDSGDVLLSTAVSTTTAPATLTPDNHVRLSFTGAPGFIRYVVYRNDGGNYYRVADIRNSIDLQFFDVAETGSSVVSVPGYPTVTADAPTAYALTNEFTPGSLSTTAFTAHSVTIQVPLTYDRSSTTPSTQYFRFGLTDLMGAGNERGIVVRRICVSEGYGGWTRSNRDLSAASAPSTAATGAPGPGQTTPVPPGPGTGFPTCVTLDTLVEKVCPQTGTVSEVPIADIEKGDWVMGAMAMCVKDILEGVVQKVIKFTLQTGHTITCSDEHRLPKNLFDRHGTAARHIELGDTLLTKEMTPSVIIEREEIIGETKVKSLMLPAPHLFNTNGIVSHNNKQPPEIIV